MNNRRSRSSDRINKSNNKPTNEPVTSPAEETSSKVSKGIEKIINHTEDVAPLIHEIHKVVLNKYEDEKKATIKKLEQDIATKDLQLQRVQELLLLQEEKANRAQISQEIILELQKAKESVERCNFGVDQRLAIINRLVEFAAELSRMTGLVDPARSFESCLQVLKGVKKHYYHSIFDMVNTAYINHCILYKQNSTKNALSLPGNNFITNGTYASKTTPIYSSPTEPPVHVYFEFKKRDLPFIVDMKENRFSYAECSEEFKDDFKFQKPCILFCFVCINGGMDVDWYKKKAMAFQEKSGPFVVVRIHNVTHTYVYEQEVDFSPAKVLKAQFKTEWDNSGVGENKLFLVDSTKLAKEIEHLIKEVS